MSSSISYSHAQDVIQAGRSGDHDTDRFPVDALLPCTTYPRGTYPPPPDHEIPDLAAMSDGERRLWMAPRRDSAAQDQLPQSGYATDGRPSGDLQPGTQRKQAASCDSAQRAAQAVALAVGVTSFPGSPNGPRVIAGARYGTTFSTEGVQRYSDKPIVTVAAPNFTEGTLIRRRSRIFFVAVRVFCLRRIEDDDDVVEKMHKNLS